MICKECHQEQIDQKIPPLRIVLQEFPCPKHGHPGLLSPSLAAWVDFYQVIAPYSREGALDHSLISKICEAEDIHFLEAFEWLTFIHSTLLEQHGKQELHTGGKEDEGKSR